MNIQTIVCSFYHDWHQHRYDMDLKGIISEKRSMMGGAAITLKVKLLSQK